MLAFNGLRIIFATGWYTNKCRSIRKAQDWSRRGSWVGYAWVNVCLSIQLMMRAFSMNTYSLHPLLILCVRHLMSLGLGFFLCFMRCICFWEFFPCHIFLDVTSILSQTRFAKQVFRNKSAAYGRTIECCVHAFSRILSFSVWKFEYSRSLLWQLN